jgi:hypothetical protein
MDIVDTPLLPFNVFLRSSQYSTSIDGKSNLVFNLNTPIHGNSNIDILVGLDSFKFTNSFYNINEYNCNLYYKTSSNTIINKISVPLGYYDIDSLIVKLNQLMPNFVFQYNAVTYKISIYYSSNFKLMEGLNNIYEVLGFDDNGTYYYDINFESPYLVNLMTVQVLHITCPNININSVGLKETQKYNILASIQVTSQFGQVQTYMNTNNFYYKINDHTIPFINILILDQDMNQINFNNIDWFMNIVFKFVYHKDLIQPVSLEQYQYKMYEQSTAQQALLEEEKRNYLNDILSEKNI